MGSIQETKPKVEVETRQKNHMKPDHASTVSGWDEGQQLSCLSITGEGIFQFTREEDKGALEPLFDAYVLESCDCLQYCGCFFGLSNASMLLSLRVTRKLFIAWLLGETSSSVYAGRSLRCACAPIRFSYSPREYVVLRESRQQCLFGPASCGR